jgi:hypothetical protein
MDVQRGKKQDKAYEFASQASRSPGPRLQNAPLKAFRQDAGYLGYAAQTTTVCATPCTTKPLHKSKSAVSILLGGSRRIDLKRNSHGTPEGHDRTLTQYESMLCLFLGQP